MLNKISVVTTFHQKGYDQYGQRMIETFVKNWPKSINLYVYAEDCHVDKTADNVIVIDSHKNLLKLVEFKNRWRNEPKANGDISGVPRLASRKDSHKPFKWDAVRFANKVYAIFHCASVCQSEILIWMDADMVCHSPITEEIILSLINPTVDLSFLGRKGKFSECGLYAMNLTSARTQTFLQKFQQMYDNAEQGIFTLEEWHDSYVFDEVRRSMQLIENDWTSNLIKGEGHPLINSQWGAYLDHLKGDRKLYGKSHSKDLLIKRTEGYWQ